MMIFQATGPGDETAKAAEQAAKKTRQAERRAQRAAKKAAEQAAAEAEKKAAERLAKQRASATQKALGEAVAELRTSGRNLYATAEKNLVEALLKMLAKEKGLERNELDAVTSALTKALAADTPLTKDKILELTREAAKHKSNYAIPEERMKQLAELVEKYALSETPGIREARALMQQAMRMARFNSPVPAPVNKGILAEALALFEEPKPKVVAEEVRAVETPSTARRVGEALRAAAKSPAARKAAVFAAIAAGGLIVANRAMELYEVWQEADREEKRTAPAPVREPEAKPPEPKKIEPKAKPTRVEPKAAAQPASTRLRMGTLEPLAREKVTAPARTAELVWRVAARPAPMQSRPTPVAAPAQGVNPQQAFNETWLAQLATQIRTAREELQTAKVVAPAIEDRLARLEKAVEEKRKANNSGVNPMQVAGEIKREVRNPFHATYAEVEGLIIKKRREGSRLARM
ncbi:hypothetical protein HY992_05555 [Candidatus Micrarchaeota archaeon]|nr:hypothetical protein [Candidatus Micrarchaeota archaeon]